MPIIDAIVTFQDYASFRQRQKVSLNKPINLLFGPNNAGKTSFLKILLYIKNLYDSKFHDINPVNIKVADKMVHIGDLKRKVNHNSENGYMQVGDIISTDLFTFKLNDAIKNALNINPEFTHCNFTGYFQWTIGLCGDDIREISFTMLDMKLSVGKIETQQLGMYSFESFSDKEFVELKNFGPECKCQISKKDTDRKKSKYYFKRFDYGFFLFFSLLKKKNAELFEQQDILTETSFQSIIESVNDFMLNRDDVDTIIRGHDILIKNYNKPINEFVDHIHGEVVPFVLTLDDPKVSVDFNVLSLLDSSFHEFTEVINYLPPLREIPDGFITNRQKNSDYASLFLKNCRVKKLNVNDNDSIFEESTATKLVDEIDFINELLLDLKFDHIFKIITVNDSNKSFEEEVLVLENIHTGKISNVNELGTGLSQILPIIVKLFPPNPISANNPEETVDFASFTSLTIVEQPEVHLHPGLQAKIGQICSRYLQYYVNGVIFFETHSEHIIKSIQLEVAKHHASNGKDGISHKDVSILYFSSENGESNIREITLDETGSFTEPWPDDFFELSGDLTLERLLSGAKSRN